MRFGFAFALAALLSSPAFAQGVSLDGKGGVVVKDGKDAVKVDGKGVDVKAGDKAVGVTNAGVTLDKGGAHDCALNPAPTLNGNKLTLLVTGKCTSVMVNGKENSVTLENTTELHVHGDKNKVNAKEVQSIMVAGKSNEVLWTATGKADLAEPVVKNTGSKNTVKKADAAATDAARDAANKTGADVNKDVKKEEKKAQKDVDGALKKMGIQIK